MTSFASVSEVSSSLAAAIFTIVFVVIFIARRIYSRWKEVGRHLPPALPSLPVLGSRPFIPDAGQLPLFFLRKSAELGPIFSLRMGSLYVVVLNGRECIQEALERCSLAFAGRTAGYVDQNYANVNMAGIIHKQYGATFRRYHQIILSILKEFGFGQGSIEQRIHAEAEELVSLIKEKEGCTFSLDNMFNMCTMNVIASIVFGHRSSQTDESLQMLQRQQHRYNSSRKRTIDYCPLLRFIPHYRRITETVYDSIKNQLKFFEQRIHEASGSIKDSFVKRFIEREGKSYNQEDLRYICKDLFTAGSETVALCLQWAVIEMANHPDIQTRIRNEIDTVVLADRYPSVDDMVNMPYTEAAILELLRRRTVSPLALFHLTLIDSTVLGCFIPSGTTVIPNLYSAHMDPGEWLEPDVYRPERFLDGTGHVTGRERVIAFSLGKRSCLGEQLARQELFIFFSTLIQRFTILPPEGLDKIICEEKLAVTVAPTYYEVRFVPRRGV